MRSLLMVLVVMATACGDGEPPPEPPPGPPPEGELTLLDANDAAVADVVFDATRVGAQRSVTLTLANTGTAATGAIVLAIGGAAASEYVLDATQTTCAPAGLTAGERCAVAITFRPALVGGRAAVLSIASPVGNLTVALAGQAIEASLRLDSATIDFGQIEAGTTPASATVRLHNDGTADAPLDDIAISGAGFTIDSTTCGATLAPTATCTVALRFAPTALGATTGALAVMSEGDSFGVALAARGARRLTVTRAGAGSGTVTSAPSGINCGTTCTGLFEGDVTLTAAANATSAFQTWSTCGAAASCLVPAGLDPVTVTATFGLLSAASLTIDFQGGVALAEVEISHPGGPTVCTMDCAVPLQPGDGVLVEARALYGYAGMSGACTTVSTQCAFTQPTGTATIVVTTQKSPRERWTRTGVDATGGRMAFDTANNLIVVTDAGQYLKIDPAGTTVLAKASPARGPLATGPGGTIYAHNSATQEIVKLDATGTEIWRRAGACSGADCLATGADGAVAVLAGSAIRWWDAAGMTSWTHSTGVAGCGGIAIDPLTGAVLFTRETEVPAQFDVGRRAADGTALADPGFVIPQFECMLAVTATGLLHAISSGASHAYLTGMYGVVSPETGPAETTTGIATALIGSGDVAYFYRDNVTMRDRVQRAGPTPAAVASYGAGTVSMVALAPDGTIAVAGVFMGISANVPFVQTFVP